MRCRAARSTCTARDRLHRAQCGAARAIPLRWALWRCCWGRCRGGNRTCWRASGRADPTRPSTRRRSTSGSSSRSSRSDCRSWRAGVHRLHQDRLGHPAVLPGAAGADRDPLAALPRMALFSITAVWLVATIATLIAAPSIATRDGVETTAPRPTRRAPSSPRAHPDLAGRFHSRWAVVIARSDIGEPMTFYSPDHPASLVPGEAWTSGLTSLDEARRLGFIGICDTTDPVFLKPCEAWMAGMPECRAAGDDHHALLQRHPGPSTAWKVYLVPLAKQRPLSARPSSLRGAIAT